MRIDKEECRRMRRELRLSIGEIHQRTGVAQGTLSCWLRDIPLSDEEKAAKHLGMKRRCIVRYEQSESKHHVAVKAEELSRRRKGCIAEAAVLFRMSLHGFTSYQSSFEGEEADFLVDVGTGRTARIQVKWASHDQVLSRLPWIRLRHGDGSKSYEKGSFDFVVGYDLYSDDAFVFSFAEIENKKTIGVSLDSRERWDKIRKFLTS